MKKFFITAATIFIAILSIPVFTAFAADAALEDIPMLNKYYFGSKKAYLYYSDDLKTVLLSGAEYNEESNFYKDCAAFFESGKLVPIDKNYRETRIDHFGNFIGIESVFYEQYNIDVITPDGGEKTAFSKCDEYYRDQRSGFFIFCTETATDAGEYYENGVCTDYYINKNGEAILLWDGRNTYEIEYLD